MATPISIPLADVRKLLEESADRTAKRVVSELEPAIAALSRKLEERSNDSERVYAALMTVLSGAQKVQFKVAYEANGRKSSAQKSVPAWRETTPEDSSDDEESVPQLSKPWLIKRGLVSVTEGIRTLGLGSDVSSSPDSKPFWDPTGRNVSVTSHDSRKGQAIFEQSSKKLTPLHIKAKVPKWDESSTSPPSPSSTSSAPSTCRSTPPSSPPSITTPPSSHPPFSSSSPSSPSLPSSPPLPSTPSPPTRAPPSAQQQNLTSAKSHSPQESTTTPPASVPPSESQVVLQHGFQAPPTAAPQHGDEDKTASAPATTLPTLTVKAQGTAPINLDTGMDDVIATTTTITLNPRSTTQSMSGGLIVRVIPALISLPAPLTASSSTSTAADSTTDALMEDASVSVNALTDTTQAAPTDSRLDDTSASVDTIAIYTKQTVAADARMDYVPGSVNTTIYATQVPAKRVQQLAASSSTQIVSASISPQDASSRTAHRASEATSDTEPLPLNLKDFKTAHAAKTGPLTTINVGMKRKAGDGQYSNWRKPSVVRSEPEIFGLSAGQAFEKRLVRDIRKTVRRAENLARCQPWFESFCPSTIVDFWASDMSDDIRGNTKFFPPGTDGLDAEFQDYYRSFTNFVDSCGSFPYVWRFRMWLEDASLPFLLKYFNRRLRLEPAPDSLDAGLTTLGRVKSLEHIFKAIAEAYLRMVLLKAQGSCDKMNLSKFSGTTRLPDDTIVNWRVLEDMATKIELVQAENCGRDVQRGESPLETYNALVESAISKFGIDHTSIQRQLVTARQNSADTLEDMHERWSSPKAYLKDAEKQHRLVSDDGVEYLQFELKQLELGECGTFFDITFINHDGIGVSQEMRRGVVSETIVRLSLADDDFFAINRRSIYSASSNAISECTAMAQRLEAGMMQEVAQLSLTTEESVKTYVQKANMLQARLIDFPVDTLKEAVLESHGDDYFTCVMTEANSGVRSCKSLEGCPGTKEEPHFPSTHKEEIIEPPLKQRYSHRIYQDSHENFSSAPLFYFNDREPSGSIDHWFEEGEVLKDPYDDPDDPDYDSEDPTDSESDDGDSYGSDDSGDYGYNDWSDRGSDYGDGGGYYGSDGDSD